MEIASMQNQYSHERQRISPNRTRRSSNGGSPQNRLPKLAHTRQWSTWGIETSNMWESPPGWINITSRHAQAEHCRRSNPNIQGAFHFSVGRSRRQLSNQPMGRVIATNSSYLELAPAVERGTKHICMGISPRQLWLQSNATGAHGMWSAVPHQA